MTDKELYTLLLEIESPWYVESVEIDKEKKRADIYVSHLAGIKMYCPVCRTECSIYDHMPERILRHLDTCNLSTYIHVRFPRISCKKHGVKSIDSELNEGNSNMTYEFERYILKLEKECSLTAVERLTGVGWKQSYNAMNRAVLRGMSRKNKVIPEAIGVDEKSFAKGHKYETIVYNHANGTVEYVADNRKQSSLEEYYKRFTSQELSTIKTVTMDMWDPYIAATKKYVPDAEKKIVFDRFHIMKIVSTAVDTVRKEEHKLLREQNVDTLKGTKYLWLWNNNNIPDFRRDEFNRLKKLDLKVSRAWSIKENIRNLWSYKSETWALKFFKRWYGWAIRSRLEPIKKAAKTIKRHINNVITYSTHKATNALAEGLNSNIEKIKRLAYGFRNREHYKTAIYFHCGGLDLNPRPKINILV